MAYHHQQPPTLSFMLLSKYFLTALRLKQESSSFKFFENLPEYLDSEINDYLSVEDQINFGMTSKTLLKASNRTRDFETRKMMEKFSIERKYEYGFENNLDDEDILKELRTFSSIIKIKLLFEYRFVYMSEGFLDGIKIAHIHFKSLYLPNMTLAIFKSKPNFDGLSNLLRKVLNHPEKYKNVLKYLSTEHYKCKRRQLIRRIRADNREFQNFRFNTLLDYNYNSKNRIIIRDGLILSIKIATLMSSLMHLYMTITNDFPKMKNCIAVMSAMFLIVAVYMNRYFNERFEQYLE